MQKKSLLSLSPNGFHKIAYTEWGSVDASRTIICVHGLTRNSRDFDMLAQQLVQQNNVRVICPDLPGRGESEWLQNAKCYAHKQYVIDLTVLIARLNVTAVTWIGTSMGGLLGMYLASQVNSPIEALILNDVGPVIPRAAISRISKHTKKNRSFVDLKEAEEYLREVYSNGGKLNNAIWQHLTLHSVMQQPDSSYKLSYDPMVLHGMPGLVLFDVKLWDIWERIHCPVLALRGQDSDVLLESTTEQMQKRGPKAEIIEIANCGHAPMLMTDDQISIICTWLKIN